MPTVVESRREQIFPTLSAGQIARLKAHGQRVPLHKGDLVIEPGERMDRMLVVLSGSIEVVRPGVTSEEPVVIHKAGQFTGEMSTLRGQGSLVRARVAESGEALVLEASRLRSIVQTDAELSELFMRAFILRRVALIDQQHSDVVLIGSRN